MNYFFAVTLSEEVREAVANAAGNWQTPMGDELRAKWYEPCDYHVTLKFLGDIDEKRALEAAEVVTPIAESVSQAIPMTFAECGAFPDLKQPRVLWIRVVANDTLAQLADRIDEAAATLGYARETRPYQPHITVARCSSKSLRTILVLKERAFPSFMVSNFVLMQTLPMEKRPKNEKYRYNIVRTFPFAIK